MVSHIGSERVVEAFAGLHAAGFDVGPHTVSHLSPAAGNLEALRDEVRRSAAQVAEIVGARPVCYAYPYGRANDVTPALVEVLRAEGFLGAVTTISGLNGLRGDPFLLRRLSVTGHHGAAAFEAMLSGLVR